MASISEGYSQGKSSMLNIRFHDDDDCYNDTYGDQGVRTHASSPGSARLNVATCAGPTLDTPATGHCAWEGQCRDLLDAKSDDDADERTESRRLRALLRAWAGTWLHPEPAVHDELDAHQDWRYFCVPYAFR
eukprot:6698544-Pyramimonas_sp.AAC.1